MGKEIFILLNSYEVFINGEGLDRNLLLSSQGKFDKNNLNEISSFISGTLNNSYKEYEIILVLGESFYCSVKQEQLLSKEKCKEDIEDISIKKIRVDAILNMDTVFSTMTEYYYRGSWVSDLDNLPIAAKVLSCKQIYYWNPEAVNSLINSLSDENLKIDFIVPFSYFATGLYTSYNNIFNTLITIREDNIFVTVTDNNCNNRYFRKLEYGIQKLLEELSNTFNISVLNSRKVLYKCGYVYLPEKYRDYSVDIQYSSDNAVNIELLDISLFIRKWLGRMVNDLLSCLESEIEGMYHNSGVVFNLETKIIGLERFIIRNINSDVHFFDITDLDYYKLSEMFCKMIEENIEETEVYKYEIKEEVVAEQISGLNIRNKIGTLIGSKLSSFTNFLLE